MTTAPDETLVQQMALVQAFATKQPSVGERASTKLSSRPSQGDETQRLKLQVPEASQYVKPPATVNGPTPNFDVRQAWEGTVIEVGNDFFIAQLRDLTEPERPDELVEMLRDDVSSADTSLLRPGAVFYWNIGYTEGPGIPRRRTSQVAFRRLHQVVTMSNTSLTAEAVREALSA